MRKRIITYAVLVMMLAGIFTFPVTGYAEPAADNGTITAQAAGTTTAKNKTNAAGQSTSAAKVTVNTPKNVKARAVSQTSIRISWSRVSGANGYLVQSYSTKKKQYVTIGKTTGTSFTQKNRTPECKYRYTVKAYKLKNGKQYCSGRSSAATASTKVSIASPKSVKAKALSSSKVRISWGKVSGATGYKVYQYSKKKGKYVPVSSVKTTSFVHKNRSAQTTYRYIVKAYRVVSGKRFYSNRSASVKTTTLHNETTRRAKLVETAKSRIGSAYRAGGTGPRHFDCSGLVYWAYKNANVKTKKYVARSSSAGMYANLKAYRAGSTLKSAKKGDILIFTRNGRISHSGIYIGNGKMVHASTPKTGVCVASVKKVHNHGTKLMAVISVVE